MQIDQKYCLKNNQQPSIQNCNKNQVSHHKRLLRLVPNQIIYLSMSSGFPLNDHLQRLTSPSEVEADSPPALRIIFFQMVGISLLTLGVNNSKYANIADIFIATSLFVAIIFSGPFSGGHVNPAVTMGFVGKKGGLSFSTASLYFIGQIMGGILGSLLAIATVGQLNPPSMTFEDPEYLISDLMGQSIGTFLFVFFILLVTNETTTFCNSTFATWASIAGALYLGRHYAVRSGGCLNPGVAVGMELSKLIFHNQNENMFKRCWVFIIGPALGGYMAGVFFDKYLKTFVRMKEEIKRQQQI